MTLVVLRMPPRRLSPLELRIMTTLWASGPASVREVQEAFPAADRPAYTTVQTTMYRLEAKGAVSRVKKVGNAHVFAAAVSKTTAYRRVIDDLLSLFGGGAQPVMAHLIETGRLTLDDLRQAEATLREHDERTHRGDPALEADRPPKARTRKR